MTIDLHATVPAASEHAADLVQFVFRSAAAPGLLQHARALLDAAPPELAASFEQAVRSAGLAS